jgi:hypothetical protein
MSCFKKWDSIIVIFAVVLTQGIATAGDLYLEAPMESGYYKSDGNIVAQTNCTVAAGKKVLVAAAGTIVLKSGFHAQPGSTFTAVIDELSQTEDGDADNLEDWWELMYFGSLYQNPSGANGDYDGDGIANYIEYKLGTDPTDYSDRPAPGISYEYDALGRIISIWRIPRR